MGAFLNVFTPLAEVGGSFLQQRGAVQDAVARRAREQQGLSDLVKNLGPGYEGFQRAIQMGVSPDVAVKLLDTAQQNQVRQTISQGLIKSGGKWTPELLGPALANGVIDYKDLPKIMASMGSGGASPFDYSGLGFTKAVETQLQEKGITRQMLEAMTPDQVKALQLGTAGKQPPHWTKIIEMPDGTQRAVTMTIKDGVAVPMDESIPGVSTGGLPGTPAKLGVTAQRAVDSVKEIQYQIPRATQMITALQEKWSPGAQGEQFAKYNAPFGVLGAVDPEWAAYFQLVGAMKGAITNAQSAGGSRSFQMVEYIRAHIPNETDPPERALEKLQGFDAGAFQARMATMLGTPLSPANPAAKTADFTPTAPPFAITGWQKTDDGNYLARDRNNKVFKYDPVNGQWQAL